MFFIKFSKKNCYAYKDNIFRNLLFSSDFQRYYLDSTHETIRNYYYRCLQRQFRIATTTYPEFKNWKFLGV